MSHRSSHLSLFTPSPCAARQHGRRLGTLRAGLLHMAVLAALAACNTVPPDNPALQEARRDYAAAQNNARVTQGAAGELQAAGDAVKTAADAWARGDNMAEVDHLSYLAKQRVAIAQETGRQKAAEAAIAGATGAREQIRLQARTREADTAVRSAELSQQRAVTAQQQAAASQQMATTAQRSAAVAQTQAEAAEQSAAASQRQSEAATRAAAASQLETAAAQRQSDAATRAAASSQLQTAAAQQQATEAEMRARQLQAQLQELNARKTDRGMVITLGDVLFDTNRAELKAGALRSMERLVAFLKEYPKRIALVEGFTDNVGSLNSNQALSERRAQAVRDALLGAGVASDRVATQGFGESFPVASNEGAVGRQANRRVEIILSDEGGSIPAR
jgi:outer membrane protein OmpA-like peptidoglycan-associated protein